MSNDPHFIDPATPVYRIFPICRFRELVVNRELVLVNPRKWEDPFENFLLKCSAQTSNGMTVSLKRVADSWYGQCWTDKENTDAMWRIYSNSKDSVRVRTTVGKLRDAVAKVSKYPQLECFFGKVNYISRAEIEEFLDQISLHELFLGGTPEQLKITLLTKRPEFAHESEVRILKFDPDSRNTEEAHGLFRVPVYPHDLIEEICFDPREKDQARLDALKAKVEGFGYTGPIGYSDLYDFPDFKIKTTPTP